MLEAKAALEVFEELDSTILEARRRAQSGDYGPVWLIAHAQTAGRGRRGRAWTSLKGNLLATYLGFTMRPPNEIALLGFAAGVALAETIDALAGAGRAMLKWPNDVMLDGAKVSGLMIDSGAAPGGAWFALGFGLNIAHAPEGLDQPTAALVDALAPDAPPPSAEEVLALLRPRLEAHAAQLVQDGFERVRRDWLARAHGFGRDAQVQFGEEIIAGRIAGLSPIGELELETPAGLRRVAAGDVLLPPATA